MRLVSIRLTGYRQFLEPTPLEFPAGLIGICGPNGVGKSKIIEAIGFALYGPSRKILPPGDKKSDLPSTAPPGGRLEVELVLDIGGQIYQITRTANTASVRLHGSPTPLADTPTATTAKSVELLGLTPAAFVGTFVARQNHIAGLQAVGMAPAERQQLINRLIGITVAERAVTLSQQEHRTRTALVEALRTAAGTTVEQAATDLADAQATATEAEAEEKRLRGKYDTAKQAHEDAKGERDALKVAARDALALQEQLARLTAPRQTLEDLLETAEARAEISRTAAKDLRIERWVASFRASVETRLARQDSLKEIARLRTERLRLLQDIDTRIEPGMAEFRKHTAAIARLDVELRQANADLTSKIGEHSTAQQDAKQAAEIAARMPDRSRLLRSRGVGCKAGGGDSRPHGAIQTERTQSWQDRTVRDLWP